MGCHLMEQGASVSSAEMPAATTPTSTPHASMVASSCLSVDEAERSPPSSSGIPSLPAWPRKAWAALPVSALTQRSTTVTAARCRPASAALMAALVAALARAARR